MQNLYTLMFKTFRTNSWKAQGRDDRPLLVAKLPQEQQIAPRILLATAHLPLPWVRMELEPVQACDEAPIIHVRKSLVSRRPANKII